MQDLEAERRRLSQVFDEVADLYDEVRPRYPAAMVERILKVSALPEGGRILEIGAGPGNATLAFAGRGHPMTCLEPGPALAARLRENLAHLSGVEVEVTRFEDWDPPPEPYDLLISGQAFHWVDPAVAYQKSADVLRVGGWLARFWNMPQLEGGLTPLHDRILDAYRAHAPRLIERGGWSMTVQGPPEERIAESGRFEPVVRETFPWTASYSPEQYGKLLRTHSDHRALPAEQLDRLVDGVSAIIAREGGTYEVSQLAVLYMAQRRE